MQLNPISLIRRNRKPVGMSAVLLPFCESGKIDWPAFRHHLARTCDSGLVPAVNMDTGFANLIDAATRARVLDETTSLLSGQMFIAGAFVGDQPTSPFNLDAYSQAIDEIQSRGGVPIIFQSFGLCELADDALIDAYRAIAARAERFLAFELGTMFAPFGRIYSLATYGELLKIPACIGAKHSSLSRELEWQRLILRDETRADFMVLTGNDLAIDMIMYGSDYLLGLSAFAPDAFALRDQMWADGDPRFYELNDLLQYLGQFAFRAPVPAYKHNAAMLLKITGHQTCDATHPGSPNRPLSDREVLAEIADRLRNWLPTK
jgi:dihydrodipicolinate synthase/N-acetylneuraminate lyase